MTETTTLTAPDTSDSPQTLTLRSGAFELPALLWLPASAAEGATSGEGAISGLPALVMLPDYYGMDDSLQQSGAQLAALGYAVLAPDLTQGTSVPAADAAPLDLDDWASKQSDATNVRKVLAALDFLGGQEFADADRVGLMGWGWGGGIALMAAGHDAPMRVVCDIGGTITYPVLTANHPGSPLNFVADVDCVIFAAFAGADPAFPDDEIQRLRGRIVEHDKVGEVKSYAAPARFWRDATLPQTTALWRRLQNFLAENLSGTQEGTEPLGDYPNEESRIHA